MISIGEDIERQVTDYHTKGTPPGIFIYSILVNDLFAAMKVAKEKERLLFWDIVFYVSSTLPHKAFGNVETVQQWVNYFKKEPKVCKMTTGH